MLKKYFNSSKHLQRLALTSFVITFACARIVVLLIMTRDIPNAASRWQLLATREFRCDYHRWRLTASCCLYPANQLDLAQIHLRDSNCDGNRDILLAAVINASVDRTKINPNIAEYREYWPALAQFLWMLGLNTE